MSEFVFDHAVVGAGIVGSWTALNLLRAGKKVLLLEQFALPHTRGSSHGPSRMIRSCYAEDFYCQIMPHALRMWREAEAETGKTLMKNTGVLCVSTSDSSSHIFREIVENMKTFCPEDLDMQDPRIASCLSRQLKYDDNAQMLMDKSGGLLMAHRALSTIQALYQKQGGQLWDNIPVNRIEPIGDTAVTIYLDADRTVTVKSVVICAGAWNRKLLSPFVDLPLQPATVRVYYWKEKEEGVYSEISGFPCFIDIEEPNIYSLPCYEYPGLMKVCIHGGVSCNPDERDKTQQDPKLEKKLKDYVRQHFPLLETEPSIVETCMYTLTPDEIFILDYVPNHRNIVFGAGFSGTGFKKSPAVGRILSEMAMGLPPFLDIQPYRLKRFEESG